MACTAPIFIRGITTQILVDVAYTELYSNRAKKIWKKSLEFRLRLKLKHDFHCTGWRDTPKAQDGTLWTNGAANSNHIGQKIRTAEKEIIYVIKQSTTVMETVVTKLTSVSKIFVKNSSTKFNLLATDFFFSHFSTPVFKMWLIQKPNKVALWNKRHFEEKKWRLYSMFKIFSTDICWINIKWGI